MTFEKVSAIIAEQLGIEADEITMETGLKDELEADSLDLFQIVNDIEDAYDVKIDDPTSLTTVGDAVNLIESLVAKKA